MKIPGNGKNRQKDSRIRINNDNKDFFGLFHNHRKTRFGKEKKKNDQSKRRIYPFAPSCEFNPDPTRRSSTASAYTYPNVDSTRSHRGTSSSTCQVVGVEDRQSPLGGGGKATAEKSRSARPPPYRRLRSIFPLASSHRPYGSLVETITLAKRSRVGVDDDEERKRALDSSEGARRKMVRNRDEKGTFRSPGPRPWARWATGHRGSPEPTRSARDDTLPSPSPLYTRLPSLFILVKTLHPAASLHRVHAYVGVSASTDTTTEAWTARGTGHGGPNRKQSP